MNVARKSTTKLPQKWAQDQKLDSREEEADNGVASTDSTDSFQDAIFNLKALSGSGDMADSDRSEVQEAQSAAGTEKIENGASRDEASVSKRKPEDKDILDQIDDIVNDEESLRAEPSKVTELKAEQGSDEDDDILIIKDDELKDSGKESNGVSDSKTKSVPSKNPVKIGEKVRSTVHSIMSKLVQNNPGVNNMLSKTKTEDVVDGGDSSVPQVPARHSKGNLFDNFEVLETDSKSPAAVESNKSPQQSILEEEDKKMLGDVAVEGNENGESGQKECGAEKTGMDSIAEELLAGEHVDGSASLENINKDSAEADTKSTSINESDSCEMIVDKKCDSVKKFDSSPLNDPVIENCIDKKDNSDCSFEDRNSAKSPIKEKPSSSGSGTQPSECKGKADDRKSEPMETADSLSCDKVSSGMYASDSVGDNKSTPDKKRSLDKVCVEEEDSQPPKRSRLDEVIGKLGERVTFPSDVTGIDLDEYEDSPLGDTDSVEFKPPEEISGSTTDEEEYKSAPEPKPKTITLTKEELETLMMLSAKKAIEQYQSPEVLALNKRIQDLQESQEEWRKKAKNLESQVLDLTVLQQRLEKRKAHTAALKSITTRSVGIWVTEDKFLKNHTPQKLPANKSSPATPPVATPVRSLSSEAIPAVSGVVSAPISTPARNTSVAHLLSQTARMPTLASCAAANRSLVTGRPIMTGPRPAGSTTTPAGAQGSNPVRGAPSGVPAPNLMLVSGNAPAVPAGNKTGPAQGLGAAATVVTPAGVAQVKVIDLTMEDDPGAPKQGTKVVGGVRAMAPQHVVRQITPINQNVPGAPSSTFLLSSPAGTQIVNSSSIQRPGMLQVVSLANAPNLRPGSIFTVMGGNQTGGMIRPPTTATTFTTNARDSTPLVMTQQVPGSVTFVRTPNPALGNSARPAQTAGGTSVVSASRTPVSLATAQPHAAAAASGPLHDGSQAITSYSVKKNPPHPAPLPVNICPKGLPADLKHPPPSPGLKISRVKQGIVLSWNMSIPSDCIEIASYQLFAYQETSAVPQTSLWKKVGDVKALPLPMACTLTQFQDGNKYHFAVRAIDVHGRSGAFSEPSYIFLTKTA
ncbi:hypothetical protein ACOMHN_021776 [Nucella lapillus]